MNGSGEPQLEVRFAVVLYGGVSLAIYMNGIAQELLTLVQATARNQDGSPRELSGTCGVYRRLSQLMCDDGEGDIPTCFVIDVISGTSAGGINGVYLAKALANNQSLDGTDDLWVSEGDIAKLINDGRSYAQTGLKVQDPPPSLLNGDRFLKALFDAYQAMDRKFPAEEPLVEELDLRVTTTDVRGRPVEIELKDDQLWESEHRHVFKFAYRPGHPHEPDKGANDFSQDMNPALALASRCTASFPVAFAPVKLADMDQIAGPQKPKYWDRFFKEYLAFDGRSEPRAVRSCKPELRSFADGGVLDNKPLGHAIDLLPSRSSSGRVIRKLVFVEPSPQHPEDELQSTERPDALETYQAATGLPRKESIRRDIERVIERNRLIGRLTRFIGDVDERREFGSVGLLPYFRDVKSYEARLEQMGAPFAAYHRMRVSTLTDAIACHIAEAAGYSMSSPEFDRIREAVRLWRDKSYPFPRGSELIRKDPRTEPKPWGSEVDFLIEYDPDYRVRRVAMVLRMLQTLLDEDRRLEKLLRSAAHNPRPQRDRKMSPVGDEAEFSNYVKARYLSADSRPERDNLQWRMQHLREQLSQALESLARATDGFSDDATEAAREIVAAANDSIDKPHDLLDRLLTWDDNSWSKRVLAAREAAEEHCRGAFEGFPVGPPVGPPDEEPAELPETTIEFARWLLWRYYRFFETYDITTFPALAIGTDIGHEMVTVGVHRIAPEDATSIINERDSGRRKLAGESLGHFGAFLGEDFRRNDILWGRLDAAERLITILLDTRAEELKSLISRVDQMSADEERKRREKAWLYDKLGAIRAEGQELIDQAHIAILQEELAGMDGQAMSQVLARSWRHGMWPVLQRDVKQARLACEKALKKLEQGEGVAPRDSELNRILLTAAESSRTVRKEIRTASGLDEAIPANLTKRLEEFETAVESHQSPKADVERRSAQDLLRRVVVTIDALQKALERANVDLEPKLSAHFYASLVRMEQNATQGEALLSWFREGYATPTRIDPHLVLSSAARSADVFGRMLEEIGKKRIGHDPFGAWIARIGRWFFLLVEAAVPDTWGHKVARHWVGLIYVVAGLLFLFGILFSEALARVGALALALTAAIHILWYVVGDWIGRAGASMRSFVRAALVVLLVLAIGIFGLGIWTAIEIIKERLPLLLR